MMRARETALLAVVVIVVALAGGAGSLYYAEVAHASGTPASVTVRIVAGHGSPGYSVSYSPAEFTVREGERVDVVLVNDDSVPHELVIPEFQVATGYVQAGATARMAFVPDKVGTFTFGEPSPFGYLSHPEDGIVGKVTVLPP